MSARVYHRNAEGPRIGMRAPLNIFTELAPLAGRDTEDSLPPPPAQARGGGYGGVG
jgi:hypothetical protein